MKTDTRRYDDASGQELYRPKQGEKMVTVGGYTRDECENLANMVKAAPNKAQHSPLPWEVNGPFGPVPNQGDMEIASIEDRIAIIPRGYANDFERRKADAKLIVRSVNHADKLAEAARTLVTSYPPEDVALYLSTLVWQDPETWGALTEVPETRALARS